MVVTSTRFLVVRVQLLDGRPPPTLAVLNSAIRDSIHENFGDFGAGLVLTSFHTRHYSSHAELCCVRVARQHERMVRGSISLVRFIQRQSAILTVVQACGSGRTLRRAMLARLRRSARPCSVASAASWPLTRTRRRRGARRLLGARRVLRAPGPRRRRRLFPAPPVGHPAAGASACACPRGMEARGAGAVCHAGLLFRGVARSGGFVGAAGGGAEWSVCASAGHAHVLAMFVPRVLVWLHALFVWRLRTWLACALRDVVPCRVPLGYLCLFGGCLFGSHALFVWRLLTWRASAGLHAP